MAKPKKFKEMPREWAYEQGRDLSSVLHNIVYDMREKVDQEMINDWSISPSQLKSCHIKIHGTEENPKIELRVSEIHGGYRVPAENPCVLTDRANDTIKLLNKFEKELKKEFKKRTGKALKIKSPKTKVDWQMIALNGLYNFVAVKFGECTTKLEKQEWSK